MSGNDWQTFVDESIWSPPRKAKIDPPTSPPPPDENVRRLFPRLCELIGRSRVTPVRINGKPHRLLTWDDRDGNPLGWFCVDGDADAELAAIHEDHRVLAGYFGGIIERFNDPDTWLLNHNRALTLDLATEPLDFADYEWAFEERGGPPINTNDWYAIAEEANGNKTICHRDDGELLMFAPDHAFDHIVPLEGCPPYTLYRVRGAPVFTSWVETVARQWLDVIKL